MNLLVVQEEPPVASFIKRGLEAEGFVVRTACDGAEGLEMSRSAEFDLIVLDLVLPTVTGEEILARLRAAGSSVPVIVLTSGDGPRPGGHPERRGRRLRDETLQLLGGARPDPGEARPGGPDGIDHDLPRERHHRRRDTGCSDRWELGRPHAPGVRLLETLMRHAGQVLSQPQLLDQVWGYDRDPSSNVVEVYVGYLRKKLQRDVVETVRGAGYRFRG